jgi:hypothetical protein
MNHGHGCISKLLRYVNDEIFGWRHDLWSKAESANDTLAITHQSFLCYIVIQWKTRPNLKCHLHLLTLCKLV